MKLQHEKHDLVSVFHLRGEMTAPYCEQFRTVALKQLSDNARDFVLDCRELQYIDSRGLETWLWLQETCGEQLGQMCVAGLDSALLTVLDITRLTRRFHIAEDVEQAMASLKG